jgi:hypothetical protein
MRGSELVFDAGWKLAAASRVKEHGSALSRPGVDTHEWYDATVPGTVLATLVDQGVYPDPYFGLNNLSIPESLNREDYWYRTEFTLPGTFAGRHLALQFKGINYYAEIWINGQYLGHITGAFIRGDFDVTTLVRSGGTNVLAVMVAPPPDPGIPSEQSVQFGAGDNGGKLCLDGPTFICTEGWDWIPAIRDRCMGLWQDVVLRASGGVTIEDPQVITRLPLPETSPAALTVETQLRNRSTLVQRGKLKGGFEGVSFEQSVTLQPGETKTVRFAPGEFPQLNISHPRLWWPNGYGNPELYHLNLKFVRDFNELSDESTTRFGIRELSYELGVKVANGHQQRVEFRPAMAGSTDSPQIDISRAGIRWDSHPSKTVTPILRAAAEVLPGIKRLADDGPGPFLVVKVNGQRIFCRGGNWGMDDALKRVSRARLEPYVRLHRDANLTMVRNWAGQSTSETFYDLCDEYGILVWNDFWMSTEGWNYNPVDGELFLKNVADCLRRFRNHPSIALWCGRNEGMPIESLNLGIDKLVRELDGTRYYQPNSRDLNLRPSGPWWNLPLEKYFHEVNEGFSTEIGASSVPSAEVLGSMMAEADLWPPGDVWSYHDFHSKGAPGRQSTFERLSARFGETKDLEDFCRKAQMLNYETYRAMFEGFNSRLWHSCSGVLVWMSHPSWPSTMWQFYTADYEPSASFFGAKKGAEPVHIQMNLPDCTVAVVNHTARALPGVTARAAIFDLSGRLVLERHATLTASSNACTEAVRLDWPAEGAHLARLELRGADGHSLSENFYWHARDEAQLQRLNRLPTVALEGEVRACPGAGATRLVVKVLNSSETPALGIKLTLRDAATGQRILPAYYGDNYFCLLPGESREVSVEGLPPQVTPQVDLDGWNVRHSTPRTFLAAGTIPSK